MKVSIITPVFNAVTTIERCIRSVQAQNHPDVEHLFIDGGSTDGTVELLRSIGAIFISEPDGGIYHAMNKGIRIASGEVLHILNADDWYADEFVISEMLALMCKGPYDLCHAQIIQVTNKDDVFCLTGEDVSYSRLRRKMRVAHPSCFVRANVYHRFGDFSSGFRVAADYDFVLRVWPKINVGFLQKPIVKMQYEGASSSNPVRSYKESMAVSLIHGVGVSSALGIFFYEIIKHKFISVFRRYSRK